VLFWGPLLICVIAVGYRYRLSAGLFALTLGYVELIDRSLYLNHDYWVVLTAMVMVFLPLNADYSVDARRGRVGTPGWYPAWVLWMLRFQVGMGDFFAGLARSTVTGCPGLSRSPPRCRPGPRHG
jgi:hypothetical protein